MFTYLLFYRYGKPLSASRVPSMYLRTYPEWALPKEEAVLMCQSASEDVICEMLAHMAQYFDPLVSQSVAKRYFSKDLPLGDSVSALCGIILKSDKSIVKELFPKVCAYVMPGKVLEAAAFYLYGTLVDGAKVIKSASKEKNLEHTCMDVEEVISDNCTPYLLSDFHNYATSNDAAKSVSANHGGDCDATPAPKKPVTTCKRTSCRERILMLEAQVARLSSDVLMLEAEKESLITENKDMQDKLDACTHRISDLENQLEMPYVTIERVKESDHLVSLHTGLPTYNHFKWVYDEVSPAAETMQYWKGINTGDTRSNQNLKRGPTRVLSLQNELLLTLMKLKLNLTEDYIAYLFKVSTSLVSAVISTWIPLLAKELSGLLYWPSRQEIAQCYPQCFNRWSGITAILDCFENPTEKPSDVSANTQIFSSYKNRPTVKFLLACTPGGSVSFISPPAGGNMSDKEMVIQCKIPEKFSPGDKCMADKGFRIAGELLERGVELILPPFVKGGKPFTEKENIENKAITHARIHVERVIGRVRDYAYLNGVVPLTQLDLIGPAATVCCALTNIKPSVVPNNT